MQDSNLKTNRNLFLTIGGIATMAVGAYFVWTNRSRIMTAVEKTGIPERLSADLEKVTDFASKQLGLKTESAGSKLNGRSADIRAS